MKNLYLRIYLTVVALLLAFAFGSAWLFQRHIDQERGSAEIAAGDRLQAMAALLRLGLPAADAPQQEQANAFSDWGHRLRMPIALDDAEGRRVAVTPQFERRVDEPGAFTVRAPLGDGRSIELVRSVRPPGPPGERLRQARGDDGPWSGPWLNRPAIAPNAPALLVVLVLLFVGVAVGAFPVVRRLTRRLEALKQGVEQFGAGDLGHRLDDSGRDEVAAVASSFNHAADRVESLLRANQSLLANASHELRSPLARLKMAFAMLDDAGPAQRERLAKEIHANIGELDLLVEEVLLASRLEAGSAVGERHPVDLVGLCAEMAASASAQFDADTGEQPAVVPGEDRLLRRALRNLLENARRYGGPEVSLTLKRAAAGFELAVADRGPGVPEPMRERIFEPFFRLPGHAEMAGGVGLGLSLVKQIAERHGGQVSCSAREGGGSVFTLTLPG
jgi:signal transduction histidine kinase